MSKRPLLFLLGITGNLAFAAGCIIRALRRHNPQLDADILILTDGSLKDNDRRLLCELGASIERYQPPAIDLPREFLRTFSEFALAKFEAFRLLNKYKTVIWLDADIAIQGDLSPLAQYGPFSLAKERLHPSKEIPPKAETNFNAPVDGFDPDAENLNAGVWVLSDALPEPKKYYVRCLTLLKELAPKGIFLEQGVLNLLAQELQRNSPELFTLLPYERFNAHAYNPYSLHAAIVHCFGKSKFWNSGVYACTFPEWTRDYAAWQSMGGSAFAGQVYMPQVQELGINAYIRIIQGMGSVARHPPD